MKDIEDARRALERIATAGVLGDAIGVLFALTGELCTTMRRVIAADPGMTAAEVYDVLADGVNLCAYLLTSRIIDGATGLPVPLDGTQCTACECPRLGRLSTPEHPSEGCRCFEPGPGQMTGAHVHYRCKACAEGGETIIPLGNGPPSLTELAAWLTQHDGEVQIRRHDGHWVVEAWTSEGPVRHAAGLGMAMVIREALDAATAAKAQS